MHSTHAAIQSCASHNPAGAITRPVHSADDRELVAEPHEQHEQAAVPDREHDEAFGRGEAPRLQDPHEVAVRHALEPIERRERAAREVDAECSPARGRRVPRSSAGHVATTLAIAPRSDSDERDAGHRDRNAARGAHRRGSREACGR